MVECLTDKILPVTAFTAKGRKKESGETLDERLAFFTRKTNTCHVWTGSTRNGYGSLYVHYDKTYWTVTHLVWVRKHKKIPKGKLIRHTCDNPACVRLSHLVLGDSWDNKQDSIKRGRHSYGASHGPSKLSEEQVKKIRLDTRTHAEIAQEFGVSDTTVSAIQLGQKWKHLPGARSKPRKRAWRGEKRRDSVLTPELVREIRTSSETGKAIAARIGISEASVSLVRRRKHWKHLP